MTVSTGTLQMHRLHPAFGVEIEGVDLPQPLDDRTWAHIWEAFNEHSLLVFHGQPLADDEQMRFSLRFGPLDPELATRPERVYQHAWRQHDLVIWDNRCMLHRGRPWNARRHARVMHRTTVAGDGPTA